MCFALIVLRAILVSVIFDNCLCMVFYSKLSPCIYIIPVCHDFYIVSADFSF